MEMIPDSVWKEIKTIIPMKKSLVGRPECDARLALNGIFFVLRSGVQWRNLPDLYGPPSTIHGKFRRWVKAGVFDEIMKIATQAYKRNALHDDHWLAVDTSHSKAPFADWSGNNPTDRCKRGVKKIVVTNRYGAPLAVCAGASNIHDSRLLKPAIDALGSNKEQHLRVLAADSAFDAKALRRYCKRKRLLLVASTNVRRRKNVQKFYVKGRWVIERTFGWLAWYRGLKICWSKMLESFVAFLQLAASLQLFRMA